MRKKKEDAFSALLKIGYTLSDFEEPHGNVGLSYIFLSKDDEPDICIICDKEMLGNIFLDASNYYNFSENID